MTFQEAITALKAGKSVRRKGWRRADVLRAEFPDAIPLVVLQGGERRWISVPADLAATDWIAD